MLTNEKIKCIECLIQGMPKTEIARIVGINRGTIYLWEKDEEFMSELGRQKAERKNEAKNKINTKLPQAIDRIWYLIESAESEKVRADLLKYWIDREIGTPVAMSKDVSEAKAVATILNLDEIDL